MSDQLLREWKFAWATFSNSPTNSEATVLSNEIKPGDIPELLLKIAALSTFGFSLAPEETVLVYQYQKKQSGETQNISYSVDDSIAFRNGSTTLFISVKGSGDNVENAIADAIYSHGGMKYHGEPLEGGKGQIKRCEAIAREIYEKHSNLLGCGCSIVVPYKTRGGRGGWKSKIAERSFYFNQVPA